MRQDFPDDLLIEANRIIVDGLGPFVESALLAKQDWLDKINKKRRPDDRLEPDADSGKIRWDTAALLGVIIDSDCWDRIKVAIEDNCKARGMKLKEMEYYVEMMQRFAASCKQLRNRASHTPRTDFSPRERNRFLDLMENFLRLAGISSSADKLESLLQECLIKEARRKFTVKRIVDPEDEDLFAIWNLEDENFSRDTADTYEDMKRWIGEIEEGLCEPGDWKVDEITLALKQGNNVIGYLFAQHYINRHIIFISYLGYDHEAAREAAYDAPARLLSELMEICNDSSRPPWKYLVGEVEEIKKGKTNHARKLFVTFQHYSQLIDRTCRLFMLDFNYIQPAVKPEDIDRKVEDWAALKQRLLLFVRDQTIIFTNHAGEPWLKGEEAVKIFGFVVNCLYAHGFLDVGEYQRYLADFQVKHAARLKDGVRLIADEKQALRILPG
jgi:hypothetical protein